MLLPPNLLGGNNREFSSPDTATGAFQRVKEILASTTDLPQALTDALVSTVADASNRTVHFPKVRDLYFVNASKRSERYTDKSFDLSIQLQREKDITDAASTRRVRTSNLK
nr:unnamed protein product [Spirometra erinaceieuropaei]